MVYWAGDLLDLQGSKQFFLDSVTQKGLAGNVGESRGDLAAAAGADFVHPDIFSSHHHTSTNSARAPRGGFKTRPYTTNVVLGDLSRGLKLASNEG